MARTATVTRNTRETQITLTIDLDGTGRADLHTGIGFFDHMLDGVSYSAMMNLHLKVLYGENDHHKLEAMFKAFAKALDAATRRDARIDGVLSTKGTL